MSSFLHRADVADPGIGSLPGQEPIRAKRSMSDSRQCMPGSHVAGVVRARSSDLASGAPLPRACQLPLRNQALMMILRMIRWTWSSSESCSFFHRPTSRSIVYEMRQYNTVSTLG